MKNNIALIGFMGAGKSVTGRALASALSMQFIDIDTLVEEKAGRSISDIFAEMGEAAFRRMEAEAIQEACKRQGCIIACGGGAVLIDDNINTIRKSAFVVYLEVQPATILQRIRCTGSRPLLNVENPASAISDLLKFRKPLYEKAADITINTTGMTTDSVVNQIKSEIGRHEGINIQKQHSR